MRNNGNLEISAGPEAHQEWADKLWKAQGEKQVRCFYIKASVYYG